MDLKLDNTKIKRKNPINRNNLFVSEQQQQFQQSMAMEYINHVLNQTIVLYEVDLERTKVSDIYNEANFKNLVFKTPVELNVIYHLNKAE